MATRLAGLRILTTTEPEPAPRPRGRVDRVVAALAATPTVAVPVGKLARRLGVAPATAATLARHAELAGMVDRWSRAPGGPSVTLTPLAAARCGLVPSPDGSRWLRAGDPAAG